MQMSDSSNLSGVCVLAVSSHPGLSQIKVAMEFDCNWQAGCAAALSPRFGAQRALCFSPLPLHLFLVSAELQHAQLSQGGLQLLSALLHLLLQLRVDAAQVRVVRFGVGLLRAELLDSGLQLRQKQEGGWGRKRLLINCNSATQQQHSGTDLFLFAQGDLQILLPTFQHLL